MHDIIKTLWLIPCLDFTSLKYGFMDGLWDQLLYPIRAGGWVLMMLYIGFIIYLEVKLLKNHCVNCFYWSQLCGGREK